MRQKMDVKKILISFLAIAGILLLAASVSAYTVTGNLTGISDVKIDGVSASTSGDISVIAGETLTVQVFLESSVDASDVRLQVEIEGDKTDVSAKTDYFDVEAGKKYLKTVELKVPYELRDEVSRGLPLNIKVWNRDYSSEINDLTLRVQRPSYNVDVVSLNTDNMLRAGEIFPVEVVLRNTGYNNLDDLYVTLKIEALGVEKTTYFGDLVSIEDPNDENKDDTVSGRVYLRLPFDAQEGKYVLEANIENDDATVSETKEIFVSNDFPEQITKVAGGLLFINPSTELRMYKVVTASDETLVTVPAGSSKTVDVFTGASNTVTVLKMNGQVVGTFTFEGSEQVSSSPVVVLTVISAIVLLILVVVLIVLMTKKPKKSEELSESYY